MRKSIDDITHRLTLSMYVYIWDIIINNKNNIDLFKLKRTNTKNERKKERHMYYISVTVMMITSENKKKNGTKHGTKPKIFSLVDTT